MVKEEFLIPDLEFQQMNNSTVSYAETQSEKGRNSNVATIVEM